MTLRGTLGQHPAMTLEQQNQGCMGAHNHWWSQRHKGIDIPRSLELLLGEWQRARTMGFSSLAHAQAEPMTEQQLSG